MKNQLVTLLRITTPHLGRFVKDRFESEGIECFFTNEGLTMDSKYNPDEVLLNVKGCQSEKAVKILLQIHKEYDLDKVKNDSSFVDYKKILVPLKLSENCFLLCKYAISLALKLNAELKLLYVYEDPTLSGPEKHTASWERYVRLELEEANRKAKQRLVRFSQELKEKIPKELLGAAKLHYRMLKGNPVNVITDASERYRPNLIIMGTCKEKDAGEFMGKTTVKVIDHSNYPVLVVPYNKTFQGKGKINVMYGTDFYDTDNSSLNKLLQLLRLYDKTIHCVHIDVHEDENLQKKVEELNRMLFEDYSEYNIKCELFESENVVKGFEEFVLKNNIDLISMSKIRRSAFYRMFHANRLQQILLTEKIPVLIFPV